MTFDFASKLADGDTVTGALTVTVTNVSGTATPAVTAGSPTVVGNQGLVRLSGGADGSDWNVQGKVSTTLGDTLQLDALLQVREQAN